MAGHAELTFRPAAVADADELGHLHVATWREAYAGLLPAEFLAGLDVGDRQARWREIFATGGASGTVVVASGDRLVGFVSTGPPPGEASSGEGWLYALYVEQRFWGTGVGYRLHELGLESLRGDGCRQAGLWVLRTNERAISFYQRQGWATDGRRQLDRHIPGLELDEIGMTRQLT